MGVFRKIVATSRALVVYVPPQKTRAVGESPLNAEAILDRYHPYEAYEPESFRYFVEAEWHCDPIQALLQRASVPVGAAAVNNLLIPFPLTHEFVDSLFDYALVELKLPTAKFFHHVIQLIDQAIMVGVSPEDFMVLFREYFAANHFTAEGRDDNLRERIQLMMHQVNQMTDLLGKTIAYLGIIHDGSVQSQEELVHRTILGIRNVEKNPLLQLETDFHAPPNQALLAPLALPLTFDSPDFTNLGPFRKFDDEPELISMLRVQVAWLDEVAGNALRENFILALQQGDVYLSNQQRSADIFQSPMHELAEGIERKIGHLLPYWCRQLCLNHGLTLWSFLATYDEQILAAQRSAALTPEEIGSVNFLLRGMDQNIWEVQQNPFGFQAERDYIAHVLPWIIRARVPLDFAQTLIADFREIRYRYDSGNFNTSRQLYQRVQSSITYLTALFSEEAKAKPDYATMWESFNRLPAIALSGEDRRQLYSALLGMITADNPKDFTDRWRQVLKGINKYFNDPAFGQFLAELLKVYYVLKTQNVNP